MTRASSLDEGGGKPPHSKAPAVSLRYTFVGASFEEQEQRWVRLPADENPRI